MTDIEKNNIKLLFHEKVNIFNKKIYMKKYFCPLSRSAQKQSKNFSVMARRNNIQLLTHKAVKQKNESMY